MFTDHYSDSIDKIEHALGKTLDKSLAGTVSDLNNVPEKVIDECSQLSNPFYIECVINFYTTQDNKKYIRQFVHTILIPKKDHKTWRKGRILLPSMSLAEQLTKTISDIYTGLPVKYDSIVDIEHYSWKQGVSTAGCFPVVDPEATYKSPKVNGFIQSSLTDVKLMAVKPGDKNLWFRRWIASSIARYLFFNDKIDMLNDSDSILTSIAERNNWTIDAEAAFNGLLKERDLDQWVDENIPGYIGDDSFYM